MGEYVAAVLANVFSAGEGINLVATRGRLFETLPPGAMLSVELPEAELRPLLSAELSIAAVNAPTLCVASGPAQAIEALAVLLEAREVGTTRIHISVAAHSQMLAPILAEFEATCRAVRFRAPELPFVSNLTGTWITAEEAVDPSYWVKHLQGTVRFAEGLVELLKSGNRVLLEVGPGRTLASLSRQQVPAPVALPTLRHPLEVASDAAFLRLTLGRLWLTGAALDFGLICGTEARRRVALPSYPFDPQRYWIEAGRPTAQSAKPQALRKRTDVAEWFATLTWKRAATPPSEEGLAPWLVFDDTLGLLEKVAQSLVGERVIHVQPGEMFMKVGEDRYTIRPDAAADYETLIDDLLLRDLFPRQIVCAWPVSKRARWALPSFAARGKLSELQAALGPDFFQLLFLAQALGPHERPLTLSVVSTGLVQVAGDPAKQPEKALLLGPSRVIPREFPTIWTRNIDVAALGSGPDALALAAESLLTELRARPTDSIVALRKSGRWIQSLEPLALAPSAKSPIREGGVYLITGGLGGIGLEVAEHFAKTARAKLVLIGRTGLPERSAWPALLAQGGAVSRRIARIQGIEAAGGQVLVIGADVTSVSDMRATLELARERFGAINGVIHSAGTIDDGLISLKTKESAAAVLAVKVRGALVLEQVFQGVSLDFVALFSSVSSVLGLEGQVDYTAANAFLDAFAETEAFGSRTHVVSIGWNAWQEIGMAVALAEQPRGVEFGLAAPHPCLERVTVDSGEEVRFVTSFSRTKHWLLSEHVVRGGEALLPGTGYLELARAGLEFHKQRGFVEISDVTFLSPFVTHVGESRELRLRLRRAGPHQGEFTFYGTSESEPHVTGRVEYVEKAAPPPVNVREISDRCALRERIFGGFLEQPFMDFGQRWANVERIRYGAGEALISLSLPEAFHVDLGAYPLHPALLDMATGGAQGLLGDFDQSRDFFVPFAYGRVTLFAPLTPRVFSHVRHRQSANDIALFDATLYDESGRVLVEIVNFTMKRVAKSAALTAQASERAEHSRAPGPESARRVTQNSMGSAVRLGISNAEGMDAFDRILSARMGGHVLASSVNVQDWLLEIEARARP
ncbi:MAG TPA: SDR family NAD(P)-dependent oxidoreductase, partial [Polyangiaceae bacterium]